MKAYIGPFRDWIGPYQIAKALCFWAKDVEDEYGMKHEPDWVHSFGEFLAHGFHKESEEDRNKFLDRNRPKTWLYKLCEWIHEKKGGRKIKIKADRYDHWNAYHTISLLALPILKDLRDHKQGSGFIDDEDVPEGLGLRSTEAPPKENEHDSDANLHKRYEWVLDEIVWAHEQVVDDSWEDQFCSGEFDWRSEPDETNPKLMRLVEGPNHTYKIDWEARKKYEQRIDNGLRLFGKYYQTLWD